MYCSNNNGTEFTRERVAGLGSEVLAGLVLELAGKDPALIERLRPLLSEERCGGVGANGERSMLGASPAMRGLQAALRKIADADAPVLITGESGTGKELAANAIHRRSARAAGPFIPINCAALPKALIASELFGHEKGAFTGADQRRIGRIQAAQKGTVFLDEIGDLPLDLQAHLLRFLQEGTIDRIGAIHPIRVDARVIAATNVPLRKAVAEGRFSEDLFFRLNVLTVEMPPLRDRGADIDDLAGHFVSRFAHQAGKSILGLSPQAQSLVRRYTWPGNVRELISCLQRAVVMSDGPWIHPDNLGLPADAADVPPSATPQALKAARRGVEEALLRRALQSNRNSIKMTAEQLGVSRVTVYRLMEKHRIVVDP